MKMLTTQLICHQIINKTQLEDCGTDLRRICCLLQQQKDKDFDSNLQVHF